MPLPPSKKTAVPNVVFRMPKSVFELITLHDYIHILYLKKITHDTEYVINLLFLGPPLFWG